jgi:hypothetical protein
MKTIHSNTIYLNIADFNIKVSFKKAQSNPIKLGCFGQNRKTLLSKEI